LVDGEAAILGVDGVPDFNVLHSRKHDDEVQPYAFDILTLDGEDLRPLPLSLRKTNGAATRATAIFVFARHGCPSAGPCSRAWRASIRVVHNSCG
jgi:hypothetical protein